MAKLNLSNKEKKTDKLVSLTLVILGSLLIRDISGAEITKRSDDIILAKGKLIMRGGKGKGNIILDTGAKSSEHHMSPMMPLMGHHFNPYSFYPMAHQQHHQPPMIHVQPVYLNDHSAMHHEPEMKHHEYHHEEPQHHYPEHHEHQEHQEHQEHHEHTEPHHMEHHEPHHEMHHMEHHEPHHEMHHIESYPQHHEPEHHEHYEHHEHQEHHEPHPEPHHEEMMPHQHYGMHEGYEMSQQHPLMSMMMHGSGLQPVTYGQFGPHMVSPQMTGVQQAMGAMPMMHQDQTINPQSFDLVSGQKVESFSGNNGNNGELIGASSNPDSKTPQTNPSSGSNLGSSISGIQTKATSSLASLIKPLFKRNPLGSLDKKPKE